MIKIPQVYVLTGTPGTGKTTVSTTLSDQLGARHIELSKYAVEEGFILKDDVERDTKIVDMDALGSRIDELILNSDIPIIIDGHIGHELVDPELVSLVFVLRKQPWALKPELEMRSYGNAKVWENLEAEIMGVITAEALELVPEAKVVEIDTSGSTPEETAGQIIEAINQGKPSDNPIIDWVTYPETMRLLLNRPCTL